MLTSGVAVRSGGSAPVRQRMEEPLPAAPLPAAPLPAAPLPAAPLPAARPGNGTTDWRPFLRALAAEVDDVVGAGGRDALLQGVGRQLASMYPMPQRGTLDGLAMDMTETLDGFGWGAVQIAFSAQEHCLVLTHEGLPRIGGAGEPAGMWLAATLVGLYEGWMAQQPGADASLVARRVASAQPDEIVIRYGKE